MNEDLDQLAALEEEQEERGEEIAASHLRRCRCVGCGTGTLAVPEKVSAARCGACMAAATSAGGYVPDGTYGVPAGDMLVRTWGGWEPQAPSGGEASPPAEVTSTEPWPADVPVPGPVAKLAATAVSAGWRVVLTYSRGYAVKKYRGEWQCEERVAVRLARPDGAYSAVAVYRRIAGRGAWGWQSVWLWGRSLLHFPCGMSDLGAWLAAGGAMPLEWYGEVTARRAEVAARPKRVVAKKIKEGAS